MSTHGVLGSDACRALLVPSGKRFQLRTEFERTRPAVYARQIADGGLTNSASLCNLNLRQTGIGEFVDQLLPVHRSLSKHRIADIMCSGLPIVNIGRLIGMEKPERERSEFGKRMRAARKAVKPKELRQEYVCEQIGISQSTLSGLEKDARGSSHTVAFAKLYNVDAHWLATGEGDMRPKGYAPAPPDKPPKGFADRRQVTPSQWALLQAVEDLIPEKDREELVVRHQRTRERIIAGLRESSEARGMSLPMPLDDEEDDEQKREGGSS